VPRKSSSTNTTAESSQEPAARIAARCLGVLALRHAPKNLPTDTERIEYLSTLGFEDADIAAMLGTTLNTVQARLSELRRGKRKKNRKRVKDND
jgi:DNA-directed RNA polymerase specialized sigma24 family protein